MTSLPSRYLIILISIFLINTSHLNSQDKEIKKIEQVYSLIDKYYTDSVDFQQLAESAVIATLKELDPHSIYIGKDELEAMNQTLKGEFDGIGITYQLSNDTVIIVQVMEDSPAEKAGLYPGDLILSADGKKISGTGISNADVRKCIGGKKHSEVILEILQTASDQPVTLHVKRDKIPLKSVEAAHFIDQETAYLKLLRFSATTQKELETAFINLKKERDFSAFILDLRGNGGGYLDKAVELADEFLSKDKRIVFTKGKNSPMKEYFSSDQGEFEEGELILLVDERSASASEIVAGAIQDWERGTIVGRRSFGKGLVQRQFNLNDSSAIRLTIASYFTPSGRSIQKPYNSGIDDYQDELSNREKKGEFLHPDSSLLIDSLKFKTLLTGKVLYGGGGISPDVFIPIDTGRVADLHKLLMQKGVYSRSAAEFYGQNKRSLKREFDSVEEFIQKFDASTDAFPILEKYSQRVVSREDEKVHLIKNEWIMNNYKAQIARLVFGTNAYYQTLNTMDPMVSRAVELSRQTAQQE